MLELPEDIIEKNKEEFLDLVDSIQVEGMLKDELKEFLCDKSDFFSAPASTKFHSSHTGGLCEHSLNVYHTLVDLVNKYASHAELNPKWSTELGDAVEQEEPKYILVPNYSEDTLKIVALFHDISKANYYERYLRNVNTGEKNDKGRDIWIQVPDFKVKSGEERFVGVDHAVNSYIIISRYIPLTEEELIAISNHHCGFDNHFVNPDLSFVLDRYPLATLLHMADFLSTYILERMTNRE